MAGKGDKRRPTQVPREVYEDNWELAFGEKPNVTSMLELGCMLDEKSLRKSEKNT